MRVFDDFPRGMPWHELSNPLSVDKRDCQDDMGRVAQWLKEHGAPQFEVERRYNHDQLGGYWQNVAWFVTPTGRHFLDLEMVLNGPDVALFDLERNGVAVRHARCERVWPVKSPPQRSPIGQPTGEDGWFRTAPNVAYEHDIWRDSTGLYHRVEKRRWFATYHEWRKIQ